MKANELRLGNWIDCYKVRFKITAINYTHVEGEGNEGEFSISDCEPILLNPEVLVKCGFEDWSGDQVYAKMGLSLTKYGDFNLTFAYHLRKKKN